MRFEQLRQRVERAESRVSAASDRAQSGRLALFDAWRAGWTPGRIVVAGLLIGSFYGLAPLYGTRMGLSTDDLKLLTALVVAVFLTIPYWKGKYFTKVPVKKGGKDNA